MIVYLICYAASFILAKIGYYYLSGLVLLLAAGYLYYYDYRRSGNMVHLRGLFSAFWVGGEGIACFKLSRLQADWSYETWACFFLAFVGFWLTYEVLQRRSNRTLTSSIPRYRTSGAGIRGVYHSVTALTLISLTAFVVEAVMLGYIPLLVQGVPHAYSEFHITGLHYFTVSCVLVPGLAVIYFLLGGSRRSGRNRIVVIMAVISLLIPLLCVSRFQLILAVMLALFSYIAYKRRINPVWIAGAVAAVIPLYLLLTVARSHGVEYLNDIYEMKNENMPIFISQPYIYIANNYENFDCLVRELPAHTWGLRSLFPLWALTGLKFCYPWLVSFPLYLDKVELNTLTLFYDSYYDFGMVGVILFACILGAVAFCLVRHLDRIRNPVGYLFYAQIAVYMVLSFFTTWFSNPATWFYLVVTGFVALHCARDS